MTLLDQIQATKMPPRRTLSTTQRDNMNKKQKAEQVRMIARLKPFLAEWTTCAEIERHLNLTQGSLAQLFGRWLENGWLQRRWLQRRVYEWRWLKTAKPPESTPD